ncbi:MAG: CHAT domain-containing protein [Vicinamibacteria bacterium]|nr:CHAT domain-containing protein [Vicinamibacteria bacterium]
MPRKRERCRFLLTEDSFLCRRLMLVALATVPLLSCLHYSTTTKRITRQMARQMLRVALQKCYCARWATIDEPLGPDRRINLAHDWIYLDMDFSERGRNNETLARLQQAEEASASLGAPRERVVILGNLGALELSCARYPEAEEHLKEALVLARAHESLETIPSILANLGRTYQAQNRHEDAIHHFRLAREEWMMREDHSSSAAMLREIARVYAAWGRNEDALAGYKEALAMFERLGDSAKAVQTVIDLGGISISSGRYDEARVRFEDALARARRDGLKTHEALALHGIGGSYFSTGFYDWAESAFLQALEIARSEEARASMALITKDLGMVYAAWGRYDRALPMYEQALDLAKTLPAPAQTADILRLIGGVHHAAGRLELAIAYAQRALNLSDKTGLESVKTSLLNALGAIYFQLGKINEAEKRLREAIAISERFGMRDKTARGLIQLAGVIQNHKMARELCLRGLALARAAGTKEDEATALHNLGALALQIDDYKEAERFFLEAINLQEQLRLTAKGEDRRSFLDSWITTYQCLIQVRFLDDKPDAVFEAGEKIKARLLAEQIGAREAMDKSAFHGIDAWRRDLGEKTAVLSFFNVDWHNPIAVLATRRKLRAYALDTKGFLARMPQGLSKVGGGATRRSIGGFTAAREVVTDNRHEFGKVLLAYGELLAEPALSATRREEREWLARELCALLLQPVEKELAGKEELLIIPDGSLGTIPFEALRLPDGRHLVERYHVVYAPSLRVKQLLGQRRHEPRPRPMFVMGGSRLKGNAESRKVEVSTRQLEALRSEARRHIEADASVREVNAALGLDSWPDLPGLRAEVEAIGQIVPESTVLVGEDVSEKKLKDLSRQGALRRYKVLHFATHTLLVPDAPELSALVLSEARVDAGEEDGYLNAKEVAELDIAADFVNLSACETGLGRIYGGEGVVGLTQAFLRAGANGLSVSLWQVADASTKDFMVGLYRLVQERGLSHVRAMTEMKREFIRSEEYADPFFWAPFVYYGN